MQTVYMSAATEQEEEKSSLAAAKIIRSGGLCALPTETVYGLGANALDAAAVAKIFAAKGRPQDNPLIVHVNGMKMAESLAAHVPDIAYKLSEAFWPGPLTLIMKKNAVIPDEVSCGLDTVGIRMPDNSLFLKTITNAGVPIAAPSANTSGKPSPTSAKHVADDLDGKIDAVIDGGSCRVGIESTVLNVAGNIPVILRPGAVTIEDIRKYAPDAYVSESVLRDAREGEKTPSPGMKYKHYSPNADIVLVDGDRSAFVRFAAAAEPNAAIVCSEEEAAELCRPCFIMGSEGDYTAQAARLFAILRKIDDEGFTKAYIRAPQKDGVGLALYNRLIRAAAFNIITPD